MKSGELILRWILKQVQNDRIRWILKQVQNDKIRWILKQVQNDRRRWILKQVQNDRRRWILKQVQNDRRRWILKQVQNDRRRWILKQVQNDRRRWILKQVQYDRVAYLMSWLLVMMFFLLGCSDKTTNTPNDITLNYFPLSIGSYWIYESYQIDRYQDSIGGTLKIDSVVCEKEVNIGEKNGFLFVDYVDGSAIDTLYYYLDKNTLYQLYNKDRILKQVLNDIMMQELPDIWFKIAEFDKNDYNEWHIYDSNIYNYNYSFLDSIMTTIYQSTINGNLFDKNSYQLDSKHSAGISFYLKHDNSISFTYRFNAQNLLDTTSVYVLRLNYYRYWFAENIGLVKFQSDPYSIQVKTTPLNNSNSTNYYNGIKKELIKFKI